MKNTRKKTSCPGLVASYGTRSETKWIYTTAYKTTQENTAISTNIIIKTL